MSNIIQFSEHTETPKPKPTKRKASRPQNAISSADRAELDEKISRVASRFRNPWPIKNAIRRDIRESCGVSRYYHVTPSQMTSYIDEINDMGYKAFVFARVCHAFDKWNRENLEKVFIDCDLDMDRFIERIIQ
ncbi:MAG: hypothetical protein KME41_05795 [Candidatus Thiodiazotropha sp. (ex Lucina pensylvanica)]|nr:hypothetical protein [Candidatus Thiodiazotropha sp. (ex Lucina pensylvanica)]